MSRPKPELFRSDDAEWFKDADVVAAYPSRPPYALAALEFLASLAVDAPRRVLDVGCGNGDIARRLAPLVESVDAVDFSVGMVDTGRCLPGGDAPNLNWTVGAIEHVPLSGPYALVTAGESLHWMDWDLVLPMFARLLVPNGLLAIVYRSWEGPPAVRDRIRPILMRHSPLPWQSVNLIEELEQRGLFRVTEERIFAAELWRPTLDEYLESRHSQRSFARARMGSAAAVFDADMRSTLDALCAEGLLAKHADRLEVPVQTGVIYGQPLPYP